MKNNSLAEIAAVISDSERILVTSHVSPDGDNIGSILAAKFMLDQLNKESKVLLPDPVPQVFSFLPAADKIEGDLSTEKNDWDAVLILDCGDLDRIGKVNKLIANEIIINLDHHQDNTYFGDYNLVKDTAATAEILYTLIKRLEEVTLTENIAWALATAVITDTGSFKYSNTTSHTHRVMADLVEYNIDPAYINRQIFGTNSYEALLLRGAVLDTLQVTSSGKAAWVQVTQEMLQEIGATMEDTEGLVGYPRSLKGAEVGVLFKERAPQEIKVSLRSNDYFPVDEIAHEFGGGGHSRAAGCLIEERLSTAQEKLIDRIEEELTAYKG